MAVGKENEILDQKYGNDEHENRNGGRLDADCGKPAVDISEQWNVGLAVTDPDGIE